MNPAFALALYVGVVLFVGVGLLLLSYFVGPRRNRRGKLDPYECGAPALAQTRQPFNVKFYVVAVLFILFDVELAFLLAWATVAPALGIIGLIEMLVFIAVLVFGLVYAWRKGTLDWEHSDLVARRTTARATASGQGPHPTDS